MGPADGPAARCELTVTTVAGAAVLAWGESGPPSLTVNCKEVSLSSRIRKNSDVLAHPSASSSPEGRGEPETTLRRA